MFILDFILLLVLILSPSILSIFFVIVIARKAWTFLLSFSINKVGDWIIMRLLFEPNILFNVSTRSSALDILILFTTASVMILWYPLLCQMLHVHYQWLRLQLPGVTTEDKWIVLRWGIILVIPETPILRVPKIGGTSITQLWNVSIIRSLGFLIVGKLISFEALFIIDIVVLFIDRQLPPSFHSGQEEAFAECRFLFLYRLEH